MKRKSLSKLLAMVLSACILFSSCGEKSDGESSSLPGSGSQQASASPSNSSGTSSPDTQPENDIIDENAENVISIATLGNSSYTDTKQIADTFNWRQSEYQVVLKQYADLDLFVTDILRGQGADIFCLRDLPIETLTQKGILEDLTPYFASSDVVHQEDMVSSVWKAGSIDGKMTCLIPAFTFEGIIVEKGHTHNGGWTIADFLALAEKYPDGKICQNITDPLNLFLNDLALAPERYIDWEAGICSFDSDSFVEFLEGLKEYSTKKYNIAFTGTPAEMLYNRHYLTSRIQILPSNYMCNYIFLKDMLGDEFELAGYPGLDGDEPHYRMMYPYAFGINSFSAKKESAWAFLEYLLSESVQEDYTKTAFPARLDVLNDMLQKAIDLDPEKITVVSINDYTLEAERLHSSLTEEDRMSFLEILDHTERFSVMTSGDIAYILLNELKLFFSGDKTAEDVADLIQNRVQLYLDEMQ